MNSESYKSPKTVAWMAIAGIAAVGLCEIFAGMIGVAQVLNPDRLVEFDESPVSLWFLLQGVISLIQTGAFIFSVVLFLIWLHRVYTNLPKLHSDSVEPTPGWAVGFWFIPIANLFKPFQAVRNAWAESDPDADLDHRFLTTVQAGAPAFMAFWWAFWLLSNVASNITGRVWEPDNLNNVGPSGYFFIVTGLLWAIASALAIKVVWEITSRQDLRFIRLGSVTPQAPPPPPSFGDL